MSHKYLLLMVAAPLAVLAGDAPAPHAINQKNRTFSQPEITIKKGEKIIFRNDDDVTHNVFSTSQGSEFNQAQAPGAESEITFNTPGAIQVRCAIHPKMKLTVIVKE
jgi:plastocyanin